MPIPAPQFSTPPALTVADDSFYHRDARRMARMLIGCVLVHRQGSQIYRARIVETEAYLGPRDLASHSAKGLTPRTRVMFGPAGHAYVYFIYGMHTMFNIVCGQTGKAHAVLIRAGEPLDEWTAHHGRQVNLTGPGNFARHMGIKRADTGRSLLTDDLHILIPAHRRGIRIGATTRVGIDYAGVWRDKPLRFYDSQSAHVSNKPKSTFD